MINISILQMCKLRHRNPHDSEMITKKNQEKPAFLALGLPQPSTSLVLTMQLLSFQAVFSGPCTRAHQRS